MIIVKNSEQIVLMKKALLKLQKLQKQQDLILSLFHTAKMQMAVTGLHLEKFSRESIILSLTDLANWQSVFQVITMYVMQLQQLL